jgi:hypothetical protein
VLNFMAWGRLSRYNSLADERPGSLFLFEGGTVISSDTGFAFRCLLRLAGLQWIYFDHAPHGNPLKSSFPNSLWRTNMTKISGETLHANSTRDCSSYLDPDVTIILCLWLRRWFRLILLLSMQWLL